MEDFYIIENKKQRGPFSLEELKQRDLNPKTLVWKEGLEDWVEARNVEELKNILKKFPPPIPKLDNRIYKVEAQIVNHKSFSSLSKITLAKEIKLNSIVICCGLVLSLLLFPFSFAGRDGFKHYSLIQEWEVVFDTGSKNDSIRLAPLYKRSKELGWQPRESFFKTYNDTPEIYHKMEYERIKPAAMLESLIVGCFLSFLIIIGRYLYLGLKWVVENSNKS